MKATIKFLMTAILLSMLTSTALLAADWTEIYNGVEYTTATKTSPRRMVAHALRIDLKNPDVSLFATPSNGSAPRETNRSTVSSWRSAYGLEAAINANFFSMDDPTYAYAQGLLISNGTTVSLDEAYRQAQLRVTAAKVASIVGTGGNPGGLHTAVAGDAYHLTNGGCFGDNSHADPRTSVGLSQDGRFLIMCVVDGRQPGYSDGATILDMSYWMRDFGAYNAINLDGGGSTMMCTASQGIVNSPSETRAVGAHLGVNSTAWSSRVDVFWRGTDNNYWTRNWSTNGGWSAVSGLGAPSGGAVSDPSVVSEAPGAIDLYCRGANNHLYRRYYRGGSWSSWIDLGGSIVGGPDACSWGPGHQDVYCRDANNHLVNWSTGSWGTTDTSITITSDPAAVCRAPGCVDVFARGADGVPIGKSYVDGSGWGSWYSLGGAIIGGPDACAWDANRIDVFVRGTNNALYQNAWNNGSGWSGFVNKGGTLYSDPGCASRDYKYLDIFVQGGSNTLYKLSYSPSGWSTWTQVTTGVVGAPDACSWSNDAGTHQ